MPLSAIAFRYDWSDEEIARVKRNYGISFRERDAEVCPGCSVGYALILPLNLTESQEREYKARLRMILVESCPKHPPTLTVDPPEST